MRIFALVLFYFIALISPANSGIGYGNGGPNRYGSTLIIDLEKIVFDTTEIVKKMDSIDTAIPENILKKIEDHLNDACHGKCNDAEIKNLKTMQKDKENLRIIRDRIEIQMRRVVAELRNQNIGEALRLLDEINKKIAEMKRDLLPKGSSVFTYSEIIK